MGPQSPVAAGVFLFQNKLPHSGWQTPSVSFILTARMKESYLAAKERWARKMAGLQKPTQRSQERLPPGQRLVTNFPVLDLGIRPSVTTDTWELKIHGKVENPVTLNWSQFLALPQVKDTSDFHCVTTWSQYDMVWEGVPFFAIAELRWLHGEQPARGVPGRRCTDRP